MAGRHKILMQYEYILHSAMIRQNILWEELANEKDKCGVNSSNAFDQHYVCTDSVGI